MSNGRKMFVHVSHSFAESERVMAEYDAALTPVERLDTAQYLREQYYKIKGIAPQRMDKTIVRVLPVRALLNGRRGLHRAI